jgi:hypothetical protein
MQDEIEELLRQERFSEATWNAADAAERERILQEYHDEVRRIMGTDVNPDLVFGPLPIPLYGRYEHRTRQITIDGNSLAEANGYDAFDTIVHENRHAFQAEAVDGSGHHIVSDETRAIWTESFSRRIRNDDYQGQLELPTEWDARGFASEPQYGMAPPYDGSWQ